MGLRHKVIIAICIMNICYSLPSYATWQGPSKVLSGTWGSNSDQFGIEYGDTNDEFSTKFFILLNSNIVLEDTVINGRMKIYSADGTLLKVVKCTKNSSGEWNDECRINGVNIQTTSDGNIWTGPEYGLQQGYALYGPTGQFIKSSATKPIELGVVSQYGVGRAYKIKVTYPDSVYQFTSSQPLRKYYRDANKYLYQIEKYISTVNQDKIVSYRVHKYSVCGKEVSVLNLPISQYEPMPDWAHDAPTWKPVPVMEYGEPIVSSAGDVYTWARTPTQYSILKWTWVDDPNVPTGPDAPTNLAVAPSINGLYLTWTASPQDPGCVTGYEIDQATTSGGPYTVVTTVNAGVLKYNDTSAAAGTMYYYKIRAASGTDYSAYTSEVSGKR